IRRKALLIGGVVLVDNVAIIGARHMTAIAGLRISRVRIGRDVLSRCCVLGGVLHRSRYPGTRKASLRAGPDDRHRATPDRASATVCKALRLFCARVFARIS